MGDLQAIILRDLFLGYLGELGLAEAKYHKPGKRLACILKYPIYPKFVFIS
jgi:hypothetical protein